MIFMILRLLLILAVVHLVVRFARGLVSGLRTTRFPESDEHRRQKLDLNEADIIDADFTVVDDPPGPDSTSSRP